MYMIVCRMFYRGYSEQWDSNPPLSLLNRALQLRPDLGLGIVVRGKCHALYARLPQARADYDRSQAWEPQPMERDLFYRYRSDLSSLLDEHGQALQDYDAYLDSRPPSLGHGSLLHRGELCLQVDRPEEAVTAFSGAIRTLPSDPYVWLHRATAYRAMGDMGAALDDADFAVTLASTRCLIHTVWNKEARGACYLQRGQLLQASGRHEEALEDFTKAVESLTEVYSELESRRAGRSGDPSANTLSSHIAKAHLARGMAFAALERRGDADADFEKAILYSPGTDVAKDAELNRTALLQDLPLPATTLSMRDSAWASEGADEAPDPRLGLQLKTSVRELLRLITEVQTISRCAVFNITSVSQECIAELLEPAVDHHSFGDFVDYLFKVLYETSEGQRKTGTSSYYNGEKPDALRMLSLMRNTRRHDSLQLDPRQARSHHQKERSWFEERIGKPSPECGQDFQRAQCELVTDQIVMLKQLASRIR